MNSLYLIYLFVGLLIGGVASWLVAKFKFQNSARGEGMMRIRELEMQLKSEGDKVQEFGRRWAEVQQELKVEKQAALQLNNQWVRLEADYKNAVENLKTQKEELNNIREKFAAEFKNLANEIFEEKSKKFTDQNKLQVGELLKPLGEKIVEFERKVDESNKDSKAWNHTLKIQIDDLKNANIKITREAENLVKALKGDSKAQGNWGEMQLEGILEKVGLQKDVHYRREQNYKSEDGSNQRLDFIIDLPDGKHLVIDSKVSLVAYARYIEESEDTKKGQFLKEHLISINAHIKTLGTKDYQQLYDINPPDYVLLFVANEPALTIALQEDQSLFDKALEQNVVLVSTSTLMATLRTVSYIWKQDLQNKNAMEIARQSGAMYDKFVSFTEDLIGIGVQLDRAKSDYKNAANKLFEGNGNLVNRAEKLKKLGAKTAKSIDQKLLDRSDDE